MPKESRFHASPGTFWRLSSGNPHGSVRWAVFAGAYSIAIGIGMNPCPLASTDQKDRILLLL